MDAKRRKATHLAETLATFGWPPIMRMPIAARYACCSTSTLQRAVNKRELVTAGRHKRSLTFRREDLDRWIIGETPAPTAPIVPSRYPTPSSSRSSTVHALARLDAIRRGA